MILETSARARRMLAVLAVTGLCATASHVPVSWPSGGGEGAEEPARAPISLRLDLGERKLYVLEAGEVIHTYPVAIGKAGHSTPRGTFQIRRMIWNPRWVPPNSEWARGLEPRGPGDPRNPMGRVKIFFREPTYYLHGTPDAGSIGRAVSHGCVRLRNADAIALGRLLMERAGSSRSSGWLDGVLSRPSRSEEVRLSQPVTLVVQ